MTITTKFCVAGGLGVAIGVGIGGFSLLLEWIQVAEYGTRQISELGMLLAIPLLAAFLAPLPCLVLLFFRKPRLKAGLILLMSTLVLLLALPIMSFSGRIRKHAFQRLEARSAPLVEAIFAYEKDHGKAPETLADLVPTYMNEIPSTKMRAYPTYSYASGDTAKKWHDNPWVLYVKTSRGFTNFDMFIYFPKQNYPDTDYGGSLERIGTWAYVHE